MQPQVYVPPPQYVRRVRRRKFLGLRCGHWLFGCLVLILSMTCLCGASMVLYVAAPPAQTNILIVGLDARPSDDNAIARTDTVMIMSVDPENSRISLFSVPRDVMIDTPNYGKLPVNVIARNAEIDRPGTGITELMTSIENEFSINIDHYVRMDFDAVVEVVDAVGGVEIDVPNRIVDNTYPTEDGGTMRIEFEPGTQFMDGETALIYSRTRHSDDDYNRAGRQQQVIQAIVKKLLSPSGVVRSPAVLVAMLNNTDSDMSIGHYLQVAPGVALYGSGNSVEQLVLTREYLLAIGPGQVEPDPFDPQLNDWLDAHLR
jgi:LCP family protein required for cell wall assembly